MTNKEKYPAAKIEENASASSDCEGTWYIRLSHLKDDPLYLKRDASIGRHDPDNERNTYHPTKTAAQQALDNFMNNKPEITLAEIKSQYEEAKKLIGKKVKYVDGKSLSPPKGKVNKVLLFADEPPNSVQTQSVMDFYRENGYVIVVNFGISHAHHQSVEVCVNAISVKAHDGQTYTAESDGDCWKFGCARIGKVLVKEAYKLLNSENIIVGNRQIQKITIGACDFDEQTLKSLVELENS